MQYALDVLEVHEDGAVLLLDEAVDALVVEHGPHPEARDAQRCVLDILDVAGVDLDLLVVLIVEFLCASIVLLDKVFCGSLLSEQQQTALLIDLFVKLVVLDLQLSVQSFLLIV